MFFTLSTIRKRILPTSLLTRFMLIIIIPVLVAQLLAVYLFYQRHWYHVADKISYLLAKEIAQLVDNLSENPNNIESGQFLNLKYVVVNNLDLPLIQKKYPEEIEIFKKSIQQQLGYEGFIELDKSKNLFLYLPLKQDLLKIKLPYKALLHPTTEIFVLWIMLLTFLLLSIALIFSKNQIKSIIELTDAAESYGIGEKIKTYKPSGAKEIRRAGIAFLKMKDRIEKQTKKRTQMLAMISHDLKTPLTRMKLQVELMANSEEKEELQYDINSMQHMIDSYLDFSRGEGGENFIEVDINKWLADYVQSKWTGKDIAINKTAEEIYIPIKPHSFERAIANLLSNAFKYSTKVAISVCAEKHDVLITIEDNGKGIKKHERQTVFKPFYRADKSRSLDTSPGVGLGLAITKEIINGHYGSISLGESKNLAGLLVKIELPKKIT